MHIQRRMGLRGLTLSSVAMLLSGCAARADVDGSAPVRETPPAACDADTPAPPIEVSPGGTPEVGVEALAAAHCNVRIIDVRTEAELDETGVIGGSEHVPMKRLAARAMGWDRDAPVVVVCRSGRRSGVATRELRELGFTHVSSLTGGVLAWRESGRALVPYADEPGTPVPEARRHALGVEDIRAHIADRDQVRMTKAATLLLHGTQACVDGRDAHAIVGTPGGDAGELLLALAAAEKLGRAPFTAQAVDRVFGDYLDAFGHFYMHTDEDAARRWLGAAGLEHRDPDVDTLLRAPPDAYVQPLLDRVADPEHVGCGHLRLSLEHPELYEVRPGLVRDVLTAYFRRLWAGDTRLEFVVLEGDHAESAIVRVSMGREVHAYSKVPLVSPRVGDTEVFVVHPEVSAFVREQNAAFLLEEVPSLVASGVSEAAFLQTQRDLAAKQLAETLSRLAPGLPVFEVEVHGPDVDVHTEPPAPAREH